MKIFTVAYAPELGEYGLGDFYLPEGHNSSTPVVLLIHGGGWTALDKTSCTGIAHFFCEKNYAVFSINYRLAKFEPFPACADDVMRAAEFLLAGAGLPAGTADFSSIIVSGGSAGGHLALYVGLKLDPAKVRSIIAISPIADPLPDFKLHPERYASLFGTAANEEMLARIAPEQFFQAGSPRIFISHANIDTVVPQESSCNFAAAARKNNISVTMFCYDGIGLNHKIWIPESDPHRLLPEIEDAIADFLNS